MGGGGGVNTVPSGCYPKALVTVVKNSWKGKGVSSVLSTFSVKHIQNAKKKRKFRPQFLKPKKKNERGTQCFDRHSRWLVIVRQLSSFSRFY